jgi:hypothetical protein
MKIRMEIRNGTPEQVETLKKSIPLGVEVYLKVHQENGYYTTAFKNVIGLIGSRERIVLASWNTQEDYDNRFTAKNSRGLTWNKVYEDYYKNCTIEQVSIGASFDPEMDFYYDSLKKGNK